VRRFGVHVTGGPAGDIVSVRLGAERKRLTLASLKTEAVWFQPGPGFPHYGRALYRMRLASRFGGTRRPDTRPLGAFVTIGVER
jgi:hypothetical protein